MGSLLAWFLAAPSIAVARQASSEAYFEFLMARRLEAEGDNAGALAALERAAAADERSAEVKSEIASFYFRRDRREDAEKVAREALSIDSDNVEANRIMGQLLSASADAASERRQPAQAAAFAREAITYLERVTTSPSADIAIHFTLGRLYLRTGNAEKAVQALTRAVNLNPNFVQGRLLLAQAYAVSNDLKSAVETLAEIVDEEPRVASALAQFQEQAGQLKEAAESYTRALALAPTNREFKFRRAAALLGAREYDRAATLAAQAQVEHPDDGRFPQLRARALFDGGAAAAAFAVLEDAVKANPRDSRTQLSLADLYKEGSRPQDALRTLRQLLQRDPDNANALNYLGYMLAERGEQLDEAVSLVRRALDADPGNPSYLDSLGWAYFRRGDMDEAEKYLTPAAEQLPKNSVIQDHLGDVYAKRGRWQDAIDAWTRALQGDGQDLDKAATEQKIADARRRLSR